MSGYGVHSKRQKIEKTAVSKNAIDYLMKQHEFTKNVTAVKILMEANQVVAFALEKTGLIVREITNTSVNHHIC
jgi:hypothetical protein